MAGAFEKRNTNGQIKFYIAEDPGRVFIHPGSVYNDENDHIHMYMVYFEKAMTQKLYIRDATFANPYSILVSCEHDSNYLRMQRLYRTAVCCAYVA